MGTNVLGRSGTGTAAPDPGARGWKKLDLSEIFSRDFRIGRKGICCEALAAQIARSEKDAGTE